MNEVIHFFYQTVLKPIFFKSDPEVIHDRMTVLGKKLGGSKLTKNLTAAIFQYENPRLSQNILGINFPNPVGLSAGFDKNAELTDILPSVGFGFAELGSITGEPCVGNPKPRLWRLPKSESLVVYYGLKNDGCEVISKRLQNKKFDIPIGISVAMTNCSANNDTNLAIEDYVKAFVTMEPYSSYITVNISCPNTSGGQPFVDPAKFDALMTRLDTIQTQKPIFIKLSPDLSLEEIDKLIEIADKHRVQGIITTNLTKKRDNKNILDANIPAKGGLSGKVVQELSDTTLAHIYKKWGNRFVLVGCGGIFTAEDAYKKIRLGASLVQLITGMIYEGPQVIGKINKDLVKLLERDGFANIKEAVGADMRQKA